MSSLYTTHGGIPLYDIAISHNWHEIGAVMQIIHAYKIDFFVEIGFHRGGLGTIIAPYCLYNPSFSYLGYDIDKKITEPSFRRVVEIIPNAQILYMDAVNEQALAWVSSRIFAKHPLIYCDGGNKPLEFKSYLQILPIGGLIMVHDYPKEFSEKEFFHLTNIEWIHDDCIDEFSRQILFRKIK